MTPKQHREHAADLIVERARYGPSVLRYLEAAGIEHTVEDAKAIFALIGTATINVWFPGDHAPMSHPYARALLAEIDKLRAELAEVNDRCDQTAAARDRFRRERDAERNAHGATRPHGFAFALGARGLADHPWQEYNAHGYLCHYPGCQMTPDEHEVKP